MTFEVAVHAAEEVGYWAKAPALPGGTTQGDTFEEPLANLRQAIDGRPLTDPEPAGTSP